MDIDLLALDRAAARPQGGAVEVQRPAPPDFHTVYSALYQPVATYLYRRTGNAHATEDLLGDVFLSVLRALPRFVDRGTPVRHWVFRIANHVVHRWLRRRRSEARALAARAAGVALHAAPADATAAARDAARHALATLPGRLEEVVALHYLAGLTLDEVAVVLRLPLGTVKSRLARGLMHLRASGAGEAGR